MRPKSFASRRGFTLVELLVVFLILAVLAGLLLPVFLQARRAAQTTSCLSNFRNVTRAAGAYMADYDEGLMPLNHQPGGGDPMTDQLWPQLLALYTGGFGVFDCPAERSAMRFGGVFDPDLGTGDYNARYYNASLREDLGYNGYYLAPVIRVGDEWVARPLNSAAVPEPSGTLLFVESRMRDQGSYLVAPPCRYFVDHGRWKDTFQSEVVRASWSQPDPVHTPIVGWGLGAEAPDDYPYGGVGTRHGERLNVARLDGSARTVPLAALETGCRTRAGWLGSYTDLSKNPWLGQP